MKSDNQPGYIILLLSCLSSVQGSLRVDDVTCGSVVKLMNTAYKSRLHSHDVKYGSGSGQQSVTGVEDQDDVNSHWSLMGASGKHCDRGEPLPCGTKLRLQHLTTKKFLHSHHFSSPLSRNQEVSAFGTKGEGDSGDNWELVCSGDDWRRGDTVMLRHVDTGAYLAMSGHSFGRPISGQMEVVGITSPDTTAKWKVQEGVYIKPASDHHHNDGHDEL
ncbi:stromal cell-derived factor 2-like [Pollicipes pollicipes]|uniref:stromal cell-derived factor 2-like n=1 Tax=Pollicipes pollicipes TaxID=41117 RepID=UPI0018855A9C|nr:stromal cell-derived factor 2-like [Pollicipes pollicipes]XP_037080721.1 stromal cell-derived factor 2-like [Pollicipes pollicipes]